MARNPYVVGQWVRGDRFYGRTAQIKEILEGPRSSIWLLGTRRIGKTSLLKELEHVAAMGSRYFPVFWDFQGVDNGAELHLDFADALLDAEERLRAAGIALDEVEAEDLFISLGLLRRRLRARGRSLLLLCDEVEELIELQRREPALVRKLRRAMQSHEDVRTVLASTIRLWALAEEVGDTSPFLHGFTPPLYIERLSDDEARSLIEQSHLDPADRPRFDPDTVAKIRSYCANHPYLLQLVCKRCLETGDLEAAIEQVACDRMVSYFFAVDFDLLSESERQVVRELALESGTSSGLLAERRGLDLETLRGTLSRLENLGFVRRDSCRRWRLANDFFRRWLSQTHASTSEGPPRLAAQEPYSSQSSTLLGEPGLEVVEGRYDLLEKAGEGATGIVYRAHDRLLDIDVAIKVLRAEYAGSDEARARYRQEILLARDLGHPNILRPYHLGVFEDRVYLVMQWVDGTTLAEVLRSEGAVPLAQTLAIGRKLASALEVAHARGILHRDIKPQNVLLDRRGEPLVADFGLARLKGDPGITQSGVFLGTPDYASPEQCQFEAADERSDIYSLGLLLFEMTTGERPFAAESIGEALLKHRSLPPPDPRSLAANVPDELARLILRCLDKEPAGRYQTAKALRQALEAIEEGGLTATERSPQ